MLHHLDRPIARLRGRTPRELILIGGGLTVTGFELAKASPNPWHLSFYAAATLLFAARFFAARVMGVGLVVSVVGLSVAHWRTGAPLFWGVWPMLGGLALLCSRDLAERFDLAAGRGWRINHWRSIPRRHWRVWCVTGYLLGLLANLFLIPWSYAGSLGAAPAAPLAVVLGVYLAIGLLFTGRAMAFVASLGVAVLALVCVVPQVGAAEACVAGGYRPLASPWTLYPTHVLPAAVVAAAVALIAAPYAAALVWRAARRRQ